LKNESIIFQKRLRLDFILMKTLYVKKKHINIIIYIHLESCLYKSKNLVILKKSQQLKKTISFIFCFYFYCFFISLIFCVNLFKVSLLFFFIYFSFFFAFFLCILYFFFNLNLLFLYFWSFFAIFLPYFNLSSFSVFSLCIWIAFSLFVFRLLFLSLFFFVF